MDGLSHGPPQAAAAHLHVPDGTAHDPALVRTTDMAVMAHPDDLELAVPGVIGACAERPDRWFTGVVCTDGRGSVAPSDDGGRADGLAARRAREQLQAAERGSYGALALLGHPSDAVRDPVRRQVVVEQVAELVARARPAVLYTHDLADRHLTHVAVALAVVAAVRSLPPEHRPARLMGCEGWRSLAWLADDEVVRLDVSDHTELADDLLACFGSQLGPKRYDAAARGRRQANATFAEPRCPDEATQVVLAVDLTPLALDDGLDPADHVTGLVTRFGDDLRRALDDLGASSELG